MTPVSTLLKLCVTLFSIATTTGAIADVVVDPEILAATTTGRARVIVELRLENGFTPEGQLTRQGVLAQREAIEAAQRAVLSELGDGDARVVRQLEAVPFVALEIGARALADLRAMPDRVLRILRDDTAAAQQPQE